MGGVRKTRGGGARGAAHQVAFFLRELASEEAGRRAAAVKGLGRVGCWAAAEHGDVVAGVGAAVVGTAGDPDAPVRAAAADALGRLGPLGGEEAGPVVVGLMGDADALVRRRASLAAERLALTGPDVTEAFRRLLEDPDWHLRLNGMIGLDSRGGTAEPAVLIRLLGDPRSYVWGLAQGALYPRRDEPLVRDELIRTARHGHGLSRARALEMLPDPQLRGLRDTFLGGLRDECPEVRRMCALLIAREPRYGPVGAVLAPLGLSGAVDGLFSALRRAGAPESLLSLLQPSETADALLAALEAETAADTAAQLLRALGDRGDARAVPAAVRWLDRPGAGASAVLALAGIGTPTAVRWIAATAAAGPGPDLGPGLGHPYVRATAATALGELAAPGAVDTLLPLLADPDAEVRTGALRGLAHLGDHEPPGPRRRAVTEALLTQLTTDERNLWYTGNALAAYPETLPAVRRLIDHPSEEVRVTVLGVLDEDDESDLAVLLAHLDDASEPVRHAALRGIGRYVDGYGELPEAPPPAPSAAELLGVITALAELPSPSQIGYTARRVLDDLKRHGEAGPT